MNEQENEKTIDTTQENKHKKSKKFIIGYAIFFIILIFITILAIFLKIKKINCSDENIIDTIVKKNTSDETKYLVTSYKETYNENSIEITNYYDIDGKIVNNYEYDENYTYNIHYIQIEGLKSKKIQKQINEKLKKAAYELKEDNNVQSVYSYVDANFANILSVNISTEIVGQERTINIDLSTGNDIKFEDLFIPTTPINSILIDSFYETLAWYYSYNNDQEEAIEDMSKIDWSGTEDKFMQLINKYNKNKENLKFSITANCITIHGLIDKDIIDYEYVSGMDIYIDLTKYINEVTLYKKYLTSGSPYEDDSIGIKNTIVFTNSDTFETRLYYGFLNDNLFLEEVVLDYDKTYEQNENLKYARKLVKELSEKTRKDLKENTKKDVGRFYQIEYNVVDNTEMGYTNINTIEYQATCTAEYFKNYAFLDYIKLKAMPTGDASLRGFNEYQDFPNLKISETKYENYYIDNEGNIITEEEALKKSDIELNTKEKATTNTIVIDPGQKELTSE